MLKNRKSKNFEIKTLLLVFIVSCLFLSFFYFLDNYYFPYRQKSVSEANKLFFCNYDDLSSNASIYVVDDFNSIDELRVSSFNSGQAYANISQDSDFFCNNNISLKIDFFLPSPFENSSDRISLTKEYSDLYPDWSNYTYLNINLYSDGNGGHILFYLVDKDHESWQYGDSSLLSSSGWYSVKIPLDSFYLAKNAPISGNKRKDFNVIYSYAVSIFESPTYNHDKLRTIYIENIYLSKD